MQPADVVGTAASFPLNKSACAANWPGCKPTHERPQAVSIGRLASYGGWNSWELFIEKGVPVLRTDQAVAAAKD